MKSTIMHYIYNYNFHIKHSGIGRKTPIQALEKVWNVKQKKLTLITQI